MTVAYFENDFIPLEKAKINIQNHAFNYGTGVFEGIRGYYNQNMDQILIVRIIEHFDRMKRNCRIIKINIDKSSEELTEITIELIKRNKYKRDIYIRPIAYKSSEKVGVCLPEEFDFCIFTVPVSFYFDPQKPLNVCISSWRRVEDNAIPGRGKITGTYVNSALASQEARDSGFDEAIFLNENGHVSEGAAMNLFILKNDILHTPSINQNILEGIVRNSIIEISKEELGIETIERAIDRTELYLADEVFLCGTMAEVAPIGSVDHRLINNGEIGEVTKVIKNLYQRIVQGEIKKYEKWLTPVY